jgi:hypothetical protein
MKKTCDKTKSSLITDYKKFGGNGEDSAPITLRCSKPYGHPGVLHRDDALKLTWVDTVAMQNLKYLKFVKGK